MIYKYIQQLYRVTKVKRSVSTPVSTRLYRCVQMCVQTLGQGTHKARKLPVLVLVLMPEEVWSAAGMESAERRRPFRTVLLRTRRTRRSDTWWSELLWFLNTSTVQ